jgi:hypothetical protein
MIRSFPPGPGGPSPRPASTRTPASSDKKSVPFTGEAHPWRPDLPLEVNPQSMPVIHRAKLKPALKSEQELLIKAQLRQDKRIREAHKRAFGHSLIDPVAAAPIAASLEKPRQHSVVRIGPRAVETTKRLNRIYAKTSSRSSSSSSSGEESPIRGDSTPKSRIVGFDLPKPEKA